MQKSMRLSYYHFPYVVLIYKFFQYFEVDLEEELSELVKPSHEINNGSLRKMGFIKVGNKLVSKEEEQVGPSCEDQARQIDEQQAEQDDQDIENPNEQAADETYEVGPSAGNADEYDMHALVGHPLILEFYVTIWKVDDQSLGQHDQ